MGVDQGLYQISTVSISLAFKLNKTCQQEINKLEKKLSTIENKLHDVSSSQLQQERELTRMELNSALRHTVEQNSWFIDHAANTFLMDHALAAYWHKNYARKKISPPSHTS